MKSLVALAVFPYLRTFEPIKYRDLEFRSTEDTTGLPIDIVEHLNRLQKVFFLRDNLLLTRMSYAIIQRPSEEEWGEETALIQLREFQAIVAYYYSAPHPTSGDVFLAREHASVYLCTPKRVSLSLIRETQFTEISGPDEYPEPDIRGDVEGYQVLFDFRTHLWITAGSRIYPPVGRIWLNYSQDLGRDLTRHFDDPREGQLIAFLASKPDKSLLRNRIVTALDWYNRSTDIDVEEEVSLVNLAIAFESLLNLEQGEKVTARFREAVSLLLGGLPRLDSWLTQFYDARSEIVHKGRSVNLMFLATDNPKNPSDRATTYRSLVSVGRQIFQLCLSTIVSGALMTLKLRLSAMFFTNQQRLEEVIRTLNNTKGTPAEQLQAIAQHIRDLSYYRFVPETDLQLTTLIKAAKVVVETYLETPPSESPDLLSLLQDFVKADTHNDHYDALSKLQAISDHREFAIENDPKDNRTLVFLLIDSVWHYTFMHYFWLKESKEGVS